MLVNDWQQLLNVGPAKRDHLPAGRIALGIAAPLLLLLWLGRIDLTIYAAFASFTGIYARHEPLRSRTLHQAATAFMLLGCEVLGLWLSHSHVGEWGVVVAGSLGAGVAAVLAALLNLRPAGALFFVFAITALASIPTPAAYAEGLGTALATALFCLLLGVLGALFSARIRPDELNPPPHPTHTPAELGWYGLQHFLAALIAGGLGLYSHFGHSYWAMVAALAPIAAVGQPARVQRAIHRMVGTLGGVGVTVFLLAFKPNVLVTALLVILMQFLAELFVARNYSLALLFVTPLALLMSMLGGHADPWALVTSRAVETVLGAVVGLLVVIFVRSAEDRRKEKATLESYTELPSDPKTPGQ